MRIDLKDKYRGGMVGSAIGDAIGEIAFQYPQRQVLSSILGRASEFRYTDDTAMAIGLAESIIEEGRIDQQQLGQIFSNNYQREPWRGYASGPPTIFSMVQKLGITYKEAARRLFGGRGSLGNGAAMRVVPVGLFFHHTNDLYEHASASAEVTHAHPVGIDGAAIQARAVAQAVKLDPKERFPLEAFIQGLIDCARTPEIQSKMDLVKKLVTENVSPGAAADRVGRTVAAHESMPFALYCFLRHPRSFEECLFCAILNQGDRDTLGAMACAISGAYLGINAIPQLWRQKLENQVHIEELASALAER
ncbi:MAG: ADP-ribosylglycohydrolase family protein [Thermodesulfobacteriota bacterium]|nr:ADP-ribosylglycohydrolase family protein [Thermodesulfobacteriota bacterium]